VSAVCTVEVVLPAALSSACEPFQCSGRSAGRAGAVAGSPLIILLLSFLLPAALG
jgi:hypothetical protein